MNADAKQLIAMLDSLMKEMELVYSQGSGYYTCAPFAKRFNKLVKLSESVVGPSNPILATFEVLHEDDPKDPADKSKVLLEIRVEVGQLRTLLATAAREDAQ